ncbi:hypothetical protein M569_08141, partial [Genlisea aurea]
ATVDRRSLYEVLRVRRGASQTEIKTAYRTLAKLYHPDAKSRFLDSSLAMSADAGGDFIEIHEAYATLSDPDARALYDCKLDVRSSRPAAVDSVRIRSPAGARFPPYRRWETDQCW